MKSTVVPAATVSVTPALTVPSAVAWIVLLHVVSAAILPDTSVTGPGPSPGSPGPGSPVGLPPGVPVPSSPGSGAAVSIPQPTEIIAINVRPSRMREILRAKPGPRAASRRTLRSTRLTLAGRSVALAQRRRLVLVAALAAAGRDAVQRESVDRGRRLEHAERGQRLQLVLLELVVERARVLADDRRQRLVDVAELAAQRLDRVDLVLRRPALPAVERAVQRVQVLADALLAGDRAALGGRDDQLARRLELVAERAQLAGQRIAVGQPLEPLGHRRARRVDPPRQLGHVAEQTVRLHHGIELRLAIGRVVRRAAIEPDRELGLDHFAAAGQPYGVGPRRHARPLRGIERDLRGARHGRRLDPHVPGDPVE